MNRFFLILFCIFISFLGFSQTKDTIRGIEMSPSDFYEAIHYRKDIILIDIQTIEERTHGKFEPSIWLNRKNTDVIKYLTENFKKADVLFLYDYDGITAKKIADQMTHLGYSAVFYMVGGYKNYQIETGN
jgi:predicted sulfurtransferase